MNHESRRRSSRKMAKKFASRGVNRITSLVGDVIWYFRSEIAATRRLFGRTRRFLIDSFAEFLAKFRA